MELFKKAGAEAEKLLAYLEDLFRTHPTADALHVTADQQFFLDKSQADNYALRLPDKSVTTVTRTDMEGAGGDGQAGDTTAETDTTPANASTVIATTEAREGALADAEPEDSGLTETAPAAEEMSGKSDTEMPATGDEPETAEEQTSGDKKKK